MHLRMLMVLLWAGLFSGCVFVANGSDANRFPGDVSFTWSLDGRTCRQEVGVYAIRIQIPGETLVNDGIFACENNGSTGVLLQGFAGGRYRYTIEAIDDGNRVLFLATGEFIVDGDVDLNVNLRRSTNSGGYAWLNWRFPPLASASTPTCQQAGVSFVDVYFDDLAAVRYACDEGMVSPGALTPIFAAGPHPFQAVAVTQEGYPLFQSISDFVISSTTPIAVDVPLLWSVGGVSLRWDLIEGGTVRSCAQAGVTYVQVNFQDSAGNWAYGAEGDVQPCGAAPLLYNALQAGGYRALLRGLDASGNVRFESVWSSAADVTVNAGQFPSASQARTFSMYRK